MTINTFAHDDAHTRSWRAAKPRIGDFDVGDPCDEFLDCSLVTRLIGAALWEHWHRWHREEKVNRLYVDAIEVHGENLIHAVLECFQTPGERNDREQVAKAIAEMDGAGLILQRGPGRWEIRFGAPFTKEDAASNEERRSVARDLGADARRRSS